MLIALRARCNAGKWADVRRINMRSQLVLLLCLSLGYLDQSLLKAQEPCTPQTCPYLNPALTPEERAKDIVARMTLEEEVSQTMNQAAVSPRLGVRGYEWGSQALHGVARDGVATNFPQSLGLAASFDTTLMRRVADVIGTEGRAK